MACCICCDDCRIASTDCSSAAIRAASAVSCAGGRAGRELRFDAREARAEIGGRLRRYDRARGDINPADHRIATTASAASAPLSAASNGTRDDGRGDQDGRVNFARNVRMPAATRSHRAGGLGARSMVGGGRFGSVMEVLGSA